MTTPCPASIAWEDLVAYWAGDLDPEQTGRVDEHLMGCGECSASSERVAAVTEGVRAIIPPLVSQGRVAALRARGVRVVEGRFSTTERTTAVFPTGADVLLLRLGGIPLARAEKVQVTISNEATGEVVLVERDVPFDPVAGEVLAACQRHFGESAVTIVFEVRAEEASGATHVSRFAIPHVFEPRDE